MGDVRRAECSRCDGVGELYDAYWACGDPACCGSGTIDCPECDGTGLISSQGETGASQ